MKNKYSNTTVHGKCTAVVKNQRKVHKSNISSKSERVTT